jgi:dTDP-4-dehydrorhamnose reductase
MNVLITGVQGLLGHEVAQVCLEQGDTVIGTDVRLPSIPLNITDPVAIRAALSSMKPDWLVNCAAYTDVDGCEKNQDTAYELNARAPGLLARACEEFGVKLLHFSTDYVFNGGKETPYVETDEVDPLSVYGKSKYAGEVAVREGIEHYLIVRTQWLFGPHGKNFVSTILNLAKSREKISVVNDQWGSPTYSKDLARAIRLLMGSESSGVYHVCNRGQATWYDLAKKALELVDLPTEVIPVPTSEFPRPAHRPARGILSTKRFMDTTGKLMPAWQVSLGLYIKEFLFEFRKTGPV